MSAKIFISYRREDDPGFVLALYQLLEQEFGSEAVFMDVEGHIKPGDNFAEIIANQVAAADAVLAVIGPRWEELLIKRRGDQSDFVVLEIASALAQGKRVVPVLVGQSKLPQAETLPLAIQALTQRNSAELRPQRFKADCQSLIADLRSRFDRVSARQTDSEAIRDALRTSDVELLIGRNLVGWLSTNHEDLADRVGKLRRRLALKFGFVMPDIRITDVSSIPPDGYQIRVHGAALQAFDIKLAHKLVVIGEGPIPIDLDGKLVNEPAFGLKAIWICDDKTALARQQGFTPIDTVSVVLTHLSEVISRSMGILFTYKAMLTLLGRLEPEYQRLLADIVPKYIPQITLQAVLRSLLEERVSIRNLHLIIEAVAEVATQERSANAIVAHVRLRLADQICSDLSDQGELKLVRIGQDWSRIIQNAISLDTDGQITKFDLERETIEGLISDIEKVVNPLVSHGHSFVVVSDPQPRPYVKMIVARIFPSIPVLASDEVFKAVKVKLIGTI